MITEKQAVLCRIFIGEEDRTEGRPLFERIVDLAQEHGVAGVTVLKGVLGFGAHKHIHTATVLRLSEDLPIVIEIIDDHNVINNFVPLIEPLIKEGMITLENVVAKFIRS